MGYKKRAGRKPQNQAKQGTPIFTYLCTCHGEVSSKKACTKGNGEPDDRGYFQSPLGTWNCPITRKKCSVTRTKRKPVEVEPRPGLVTPTDGLRYGHAS